MVDQPEQQGQVLPRYMRTPPGVPSLIGLEPRKFGRNSRRYFSENPKVRARRKPYWGQSPILILIILAVFIAYFFENMRSDHQTDGVSETAGLSENAQSSFTTNTMACRETLDLVCVYY